MITTATLIDWINADSLILDNDTLTDDARNGAAIRIEHNMEAMNRRADAGDVAALDFLAAEAERYNAEIYGNEDPQFDTLEERRGER